MIRLPLIWPSTADAVWQAPTSDGWSVAVHRYGHGDRSRPAVMLLHGALANSRSFDIGGFGLAPYLRDQGFNAFAVDFRGRGYSQAPQGAGGWTVDDLIRHDIPAALAEIRRRTGVERVHAAGHSLGGMALYGYLDVDGAGIDKVATISASATLDIPAPLRLVVPGLSHFFLA